MSQETSQVTDRKTLLSKWNSEDPVGAAPRTMLEVDRPAAEATSMLTSTNELKGPGAEGKSALRHLMYKRALRKQKM